MSADVTGRKPSGRGGLFRLLPLLLGICLACSGSAEAAQSTFRTYGVEQGLTNVGGACMLQDRAGYILVCTEQGVYAYDGRRFVNLGTSQGLREGGFIYGLTLTTSGRLAVEYSDEVRLSDRPTDAVHPPSSLHFTPVLHPGISLHSNNPHRMVPWRDGLVLIAGANTVRVVIPARGSPHVATMGYDRAEEALLDHASAVFSVDDHLWEVFRDGRLCAADPGAVRCYAVAGRPAIGSWFDVVSGPGKTVVARSAFMVGTLYPASGRWEIVSLPDQADRYTNFLPWLGLFKDPEGNLVTQTDRGIAVLRDGIWEAKSVAEGAPAGTIVGAMTDATGQFWLQAVGSGLIRWVGYGRWEAIDRTDGLPDGFAWRTARMPDGTMWVATDTGVVEVDRSDGGLQVGRIVPGSSFSLAIGPEGKVWSSFGIHGLRIIDPVDGSWVRLATPAVNSIVPDPSGFVWLGTQGGLLRADAFSPASPQALPEGPSRVQVVDVASDGAGGVFYLAAGHLRHRHRDGSDVPVTGPWPSDSFDPLVMVLGRDGSLWIGGPSGLLRFRLADDHVSSFEPIPTAATQSSTIVALMVDHRGWIWAGSALGVSVFDGSRWVSLDASDGLLASDVDQGGLREDPDGSVWIVTSRGLSHLLDPSRLFADQPIRVLISEARLGESYVTGKRMPYSNQGLSLQFGTPTYGAERSVIFRYRLSGVDADWVETTTGNVRYAFVPPGRHVLTVVGIDRLTHRTSSACTLVVDVAYPWWRRWWAEAIWLSCIIGMGYGGMRLRLRATLARQAELERHVLAATVQLRARTEELHHQAAHDSLTGLLNRAAIERRLAAILAGGCAGGEILMALLDIDHFKRINDRYGHLVGDDVLRVMGQLVAGAVGDGELAGRYGGEEILLVLKDVNGNGAERVLDLHWAVQAEAFEAAGTSIGVTCSIGLTWATHGDDWESILGRADKALYEAKTGGRNRIVQSPGIHPVTTARKADGSRPGLRR